MPQRLGYKRNRVILVEYSTFDWMKLQYPDISDLGKYWYTFACCKKYELCLIPIAMQAEPDRTITSREIYENECCLCLIPVCGLLEPFSHNTGKVDTFIARF